MIENPNGSSIPIFGSILIFEESEDSMSSIARVKMTLDGVELTSLINLRMPPQFGVSTMSVPDAIGVFGRG